MKPKDKNAAQAAGASKQKKQLMVLGGLVAVLAVVMLIQFGGKSPDSAQPAQALEHPADAASAAVAEATASANTPAAAPAAAPAVPTPPPVDNAVLNHPAEGDGLVRSPFSNFWSVARSGGGGGAANTVAPPPVTLNATMPSSSRALAVIDGELHCVGDSIQGWELAEVGARSIVLRSPTHATVTIEMPLLAGASSLMGSSNR